jgi:hypothetical protein
MEEEYFELLSGIKLEPELLKVAEEIVTRIWNEKVQNTALSQESAQAEIQAIEKEITEYIKLIPGTQSQGLRVRYEARVEELDQQLKQLESGLKNKKVPNFEEARDLALRFLGTPAETWQNALKEVKNMVHNMIFEVNPSYCLKDGFGTPHLTLPFSIKEHILAVNANLVDHTGVEPVTSAMRMPHVEKYIINLSFIPIE